MRKTGRWLLRVAVARVAVLVAPLAILLLAGCASDSVGGRPMAAFRPDERGRDTAGWTGAGAQESTRPAAGTAAAKPSGVKRPTQQAQPSGAATPKVHGSGRQVKQGDKLTISLRGIQPAEEVQEVVDNLGCVTLPLIGEVKVEGKTMPEAEKAIETSYVDGGYYRKITVIVVAQDEEFYVQGEVQRQGSFQLNGDVTLLQAVAMAGGFTDFAKETKIEIRRDDKVLIFDAKRIRELKDKDPLIRPNDNIIVPRRWFL